MQLSKHEALREGGETLQHAGAAADGICDGHAQAPRLHTTAGGPRGRGLRGGPSAGSRRSWVLQLGGLHPCAHGRAWVPQLEGGSYTRRAGGSYTRRAPRLHTTAGGPRGRGLREALRLGAAGAGCCSWAAPMRAHGRAWVPQLEGGSYTQRAGGSYGGRGGRVAAARARTRYSWSGRWGSEILNFADTSILHVPRHGGRKPHTAGGSYKPGGIFILNGLADATWQGD